MICTDVFVLKGLSVTDISVLQGLSLRQKGRERFFVVFTDASDLRGRFRSPFVTGQKNWLVTDTARDLRPNKAGDGSYPFTDLVQCLGTSSFDDHAPFSPVAEDARPVRARKEPDLF